jgi:hypothetical protein
MQGSKQVKKTSKPKQAATETAAQTVTEIPMPSAIMQKIIQWETDFLRRTEEMRAEVQKEVGKVCETVLAVNGIDLETHGFSFTVKSGKITVYEKQTGA